MLSLILFLLISNAVYHFLKDLGKEVVPVKKKRVKKRLAFRGHRFMIQSWFFGIFRRLVRVRPRRKRRREEKRV